MMVCDVTIRTEQPRSNKSCRALGRDSQPSDDLHFIKFERDSPIGGIRLSVRSSVSSKVTNTLGLKLLSQSKDGFGW